MPDRVAYPALALLAAGMIALAVVWPQGRGAPSPAPFGHPLAPLQTTVTVEGHAVSLFSHGKSGLSARGKAEPPRVVSP
jgi:hypothetical protein